MPIMAMVRRHANLTQFEDDRLRRLEELTGLAVAEMIRRAVDEYLENQEPKVMAAIDRLENGRK